jgi:hypothetical protein
LAATLLQAPFVRFDLPGLGADGAGGCSLATSPSSLPRGRDANFLAAFVAPVLLPSHALFMPTLTVRVLDRRLGGLDLQAVGSCAVPLLPRVPWCSNDPTQSSRRVDPTAPAAEDDDEDDVEDDDDDEEEADKNEEGDDDDKKKPHSKGGGSTAPRELTVTGGSGLSAASQGTGDDANDDANDDLEAFLRRGEAQGAGQPWWRGGGPLAARPGAAATEEGWFAAAFGDEAAVPDELDARHLGVEFPTTWASAAFREVKKEHKSFLFSSR